MSEKEIYAVYVGIKNVHKKYAAHVRDMTYLPALIADINKLNSTCNSNFCNAMTEVLRQWFIGRFLGVDSGKLKDFDTVWKMTIDDIEALNKKFGECRQLQLYALAILDELECST